MTDRRPTPREPRAIPSAPLVALLCVLLLLFVVASALLLWRERGRSSSVGQRVATHDSMTYTYTHDGDVIRVYVVTDPDSGIQYVVSDHGGMCPRLDRYGNVVGARTYD